MTSQHEPTTRRPRIGLTTYLQEGTWGVWQAVASILDSAYLDAVVTAGGTPMLLPPVCTDTDVLDVLDGLIIVGGSDLDPSLYGQEPHPRTVFRPDRDEHDLALTRAALDRGLPLLAICRGAQVLNVVLGGSLHQHIPDLLPGANYQPAPGVFGQVTVDTTEGSRLRDAVGARVTVPCYHHQAIDRVGEGLTVTGRSPDGLIQAIEGTRDAWVVGVQFHPEQNSADLRIFQALVAAIAENEEAASR